MTEEQHFSELRKARVHAGAMWLARAFPANVTHVEANFHYDDGQVVHIEAHWEDEPPDCAPAWKRWLRRISR